jgi:stress response protein YsnF
MKATRKKTRLIDQHLVDKVRRIYRAKTETEAVTHAMEEAAFREEVRKAFKTTAGKIPRMEKVF